MTFAYSNIWTSAFATSTLSLKIFCCFCFFGLTLGLMSSECSMMSLLTPCRLEATRQRCLCFCLGLSRVLFLLQQRGLRRWLLFYLGGRLQEGLIWCLLCPLSWFIPKEYLVVRQVGLRWFLQNLYSWALDIVFSMFRASFCLSWTEMSPCSASIFMHK